MRISYSSRFFLYAPLGLFLCLAAWVMAHWWLAAQAFDRKLQALRGHQAAPGITVTWSNVTISGFPFRIDALFDDLRVSGAGAHGPFAWRSEKFLVHFLTYNEDKQVYEAEGRQRLHWTGGDGKAHDADLQIGGLQASSILRAGALARFDLHVIAAASPGFTVADLQFHLRRDPDAKGLDLMLRADDMTSDTGIAPLGRHVTGLRLYETLTDAAPFMPLLAGAASWPDAAKAWRGAALVTNADVQADGLTGTAKDPRLTGLLSFLY